MRRESAKGEQQQPAAADLLRQNLPWCIVLVQQVKLGPVSAVAASEETDIEDENRRPG